MLLQMQIHEREQSGRTALYINLQPILNKLSHTVTNMVTNIYKYSS